MAFGAAPLVRAMEGAASPPPQLLQRLRGHRLVQLCGPCSRAAIFASAAMVASGLAPGAMVCVTSKARVGGFLVPRRILTSAPKAPTVDGVALLVRPMATPPPPLLPPPPIVSQVVDAGFA